jgi:hypothetical protein
MVVGVHPAAGEIENYNLSSVPETTELYSSESEWMDERYNDNTHAESGQRFSRMVDVRPA